MAGKDQRNKKVSEYIYILGKRHLSCVPAMHDDLQMGVGCRRHQLSDDVLVLSGTDYYFQQQVVDEVV